ncbi:MAG: hypothetical protein Q9187_000852 [Circinaria calcarea]
MMPTDGATARFLYTILKQLDHKSIDWNIVAGDLDITNGHAARMRFSRFKQHMEGVPPTPRKPRASGSYRQKKAKSEKRTDDEKKPKTELQQHIKPDPMEIQIDMPEMTTAVKSECFVKKEAVDHVGVEELSLGGFASLAPTDQMEIPLHMAKEDVSSVTYLEDSACMNGSWLLPAPTVKREPMVKMEPRWEK